MLARVAAALVAAGLLAAAPASATVPGGNLLFNPGAEAGPGSPDSSAIDAPPGWAATGEMTAVAYGVSGFPTTADGAALGGGANFFAGGNAAESTATQVVDLSAAAAEIDAGSVTATLAAQLGGYASQDDAATVTATYQNALGGPLGTVTIGPVTAQDRGSVTALLPRSASGAVPAGTRKIAVRLDAVRVAGSYNDGYADNISLTLGSGTPQFHKTVVVQVISGKVLVKRPGSAQFVAIDGSQGIPLGSTVDTKAGVIALSSVPKAGAKAQHAKFYDGIFKVTQPGGITQLALAEGLAPCGRTAGAAAKKPKTRKLWGDGSGSFRTRGQYSSATVRGTKWLVQDSCAGTLTRVTKGVVTVRDLVKHKTVIVRAGKRYLAKR